MALVHMLTMTDDLFDLRRGCPCTFVYYKEQPILITRDSTSNNYIALAHFTAFNEPLAVLEGHSSPVFLLQASSDSRWLCSISMESVLLWQLDTCLFHAIPSEGCSPSGKCVTDGRPFAPTKSIHLDCNVRDVSFVCFSDSSDSTHLMAICCRNTCAVIRACDKVCIGKLTHSGSITSAGFVPNNPNHLITIDNRTFKLWDVKDGMAMTESSTMISSFTCLSVHSHYIALGSANGKIRLYSIGSNQSACELDVKSLVKQQSQDDSSVDKEAGCVDIMLYSTFNGSDDATPSCLQSMVDDRLMLVIITTDAIIVIDVLNREVLYESDVIDSLPVSDGHFPSPLTAARCLSYIDHHQELYFYVQDVFSKKLTFFKLNCPNATKENAQLLSVLSSEPLVQNSSLKAELIPHLDAKKPISKNVRFQDNPVTFKPSVKSSGYSQSPRTKLFQPQTNISGSSRTSAGTSGSSSRTSAGTSGSSSRTSAGTSGSSGRTSAGTSGSSSRTSAGTSGSSSRTSAGTSGRTSSSRPMEVVRSHSSSKPKSSQPKSLLSDFNPLNAELINSINIHDPRPVPLMQSTYDNNGTLFACVGLTPLIYLIKTNQPTKYTVLQGHEGFVRGVAWSHGDTRLLSASVDKTVHLWSPSNPTHHQYQSVMTLSHTLHNFKHKPDDNNVRFGSEISHVSFYYIDKFILLCSANILYMYKYYIDSSSPDDIRRYQTRNYYKKVTSLSQPSSHAITALSTINDFHSYIVLSAGSNQSLTAYDMNIGREVWQKEQAHSRYIHCITQNKGTRYRSLTSDAYDLFATSSISDGIKLWDLRTQRYVRWYTSYTNRSQPVMASFSPCGRYIATGSEDNSAVVYDIRYIEPLVKLSCSSNVVSSVSFNPVSSELTSCTLDGIINFYSNKKYT